MLVVLADDDVVLLVLDASEAVLRYDTADRNDESSFCCCSSMLANTLYIESVVVLE